MAGLLQSEAQRRKSPINPATHRTEVHEDKAELDASSSLLFLVGVGHDVAVHPGVR